MINFKYLNKLIDQVNSIRKRTEYCGIDTTGCIISYMATKKVSFVGHREGYGGILYRSNKGIKESDKISSRTKNFLKLIKNKNGELIQMESYVEGKMDCLYQVHWIDNARYLFPFSSTGGYYPTYTCVTKYAHDHVTEEYMVSGNQIVYESYSRRLNKSIRYRFVNYVRGGTIPVLEQKKGSFSLNPLSYREYYNKNWLSR